MEEIPRPEGKGLTVFEVGMLVKLRDDSKNKIPEGYRRLIRPDNIYRVLRWDVIMDGNVSKPILWLGPHDMKGSDADEFHPIRAREHRYKGVFPIAAGYFRPSNN